MGRTVRTQGGLRHAPPLVQPADANPPPRLSFSNLVEAHVIRALRLDHQVSMPALRQAIDVAQSRLRIDRLLLSPELRTHGGKLLLDTYLDLIDLSAGGQLVLRRMFDEHLQRVEWDHRVPVRLFPCPSSDRVAPSAKPVSIDAAVAFGRPILVRSGVKTRSILDRINAGETAEDIAEDHGIDVPDVPAAVLFELAA